MEGRLTSETGEALPNKSRHEQGHGSFTWWHSFWRGSAGSLIWKVAVAAVGALLVVGGVVMLPLPGPGWLVIFAGLAILATEFAWAKGMLDRARSFVRLWTGWVMAQPLVVRLAIGAAGLAVAGVALWVGLKLTGAPSWFPNPVATYLGLN